MNIAELKKLYKEVTRELSFSDEQRIINGELTEDDQRSPKMKRARELYLQIKEANKQLNDERNQVNQFMEAEYESGSLKNFVDNFKGV